MSVKNSVVIELSQLDEGDIFLFEGLLMEKVRQYTTDGIPLVGYAKMGKFQGFFNIPLGNKVILIQKKDG